MRPISYLALGGPGGIPTHDSRIGTRAVRPEVYGPRQVWVKAIAFRPGYAKRSWPASTEKTSAE